MAFLVVGIHTGPFEFNIWLDRGFGLITRFCVPFFFVISAFFFFKSEKPLRKYLIRNIILYVVWVIIYCCFGIKDISNLSTVEILRLFIWDGYGVAWYLLATIYGTIIIFCLRKYIGSEKCRWCGYILYFVGCLISTWSPVLIQCFDLNLKSVYLLLGFRNGLFYAPAFVALGLLLVNKKEQVCNKKRNILCFIWSFIGLVVECVVLVIGFKTKDTTLFLATLPATYFLCNIILNSYIAVSKNIALVIRKISILVYFVHPIINYFLKLNGWHNSFTLFIIVSGSCCLISYLIIKASEKINILKYLI